MAPKIETSDYSATPVHGFSTEVYERNLEIIWMSKDDIENFEAKISDKGLFSGLATFALGAALPFGIEKGVDFYAGGDPVDLALLILSGASGIFGLFCAFIAYKKSRKVSTFREKLFQNERLTSRKFTLVDSSASNPVQITAT